MEALPYKVIKSLEQYKEYCNILEDLVVDRRKSLAHQAAIDLLTSLIEKWDEEHNSFSDADPL
jgi:HTH-type transcriptional regulator/antitoxin HigA